MELRKEQYEQIKECFPKQRKPAKISNLEVLNAVLYVVENGCKWRGLCGAPEPGTMVGTSSPPVILAVSLGLFFLVYLLYTVIAYVSMKRNVLPDSGS